MNHTPNDESGPLHSFLSPEAVRLDLPVSGPAPRMLAYAIDFVLVGIILILLLVFVFESIPLGARLEHWIRAEILDAARKLAAAKRSSPQPVQIPGLLMAFFLLAQFLVEMGYFIFWEMVSGGRSPGKYFVQLRVVKENGAPIDIRSSVVRNVMRLVDMLPAEYLIGLLSILFSPSAQRLGDHVAGTIVVRLDRPEAAGDMPQLVDATPIVLTREQIARLGPREVQLMRRVLRRAYQTPSTAREALLSEVAHAMRQRLDLPESPGLSALDFLRGVLAAAERASRR
ncbi:MAG TPA: RDD family protein [Candidatus Binataceae bacterium]|nr:RDD family protein [Candidatus Binataceae bacterium]